MTPDPFEHGACLSDEPRRWAERALRELDQPGRAIVIVGAEGLGKTTHLRALEAALTARGGEAAYHYVAPGVARGAPEGVPEPRSDIAYLLDEADRLKSGRLLAFARTCRERACRLALAAHRDVSRPLRRAGWEVGLTKLRGFADPEETQAAVQRALDQAGAELRLSLAAAARLFHLTRGNYRLIWAVMYEAWEDRGATLEMRAEAVDRAAQRLRRANAKLGAALRS